MKEIMISIQPRWVADILNGDKTIEVRKTKPNCDLPVKVYIYCTNTGRPLVYGDVQVGLGDFVEKYTQTYNWGRKDAEKIWGVLNGKVVAEFTLNKIETIHEGEIYNADKMMRYAGLSSQMLNEYTKGKTFYCWHIDDLIVYDEPKLLQNFFYPCDGCEKLGTDRCTEEFSYCKAKVVKPPQSWCYCEIYKEKSNERN